MNGTIEVKFIPLPTEDTEVGREQQKIYNELLLKLTPIILKEIREGLEPSWMLFSELTAAAVSSNVAAKIAFDFSRPEKFPVKETAEAVERLWRQMEDLQSELIQTRNLLSQTNQPTAILQSKKDSPSPFLFLSGLLVGCLWTFIICFFYFKK